MINEVELREGLSRLLDRTEKDIRVRLDDEPELETTIRARHQAASDAGRAAANGYTAFRDDAITQAAVHWLLGCVFVRFLEDNQLIEDAWIAGPGERLTQAQDRRAMFYREHPHASDRDYLLDVFTRVAGLPGLTGLFDRKRNPLWSLGPSGTQAMAILDFFQKREEDSGGLLYDFTDPVLGTRFLGDLYQNLSESARKRYALCQTPDFVVDFILDRTLNPALDVFGLEQTQLIDPTCGSGHFLLAAFDRLYARWLEREPTQNAAVLAQRCLDAIHGVDLNPFATEIARFRLLIAALRVCKIRGLKEAPDFRFQLATGDSLLHGRLLGRERSVQYVMGHDPSAHFYENEDREALEGLLGQQYQAVVGNPPYINVSDPALRETYRARYGSCSGKYQLTVPFIEKSFNLAIANDRSGSRAGFVGLIISNAFMKRQFGKSIVEEYLACWNLTHVIDMSGAYLPAFGTPTAVIFGTHDHPVASTIRAVLGIRAEADEPAEPEKGSVWTAIVTQVEHAGSESQWISVADTPRLIFSKHPWSIGGGGASVLRSKIEDSGIERLEAIADDVGVQFVSLDEIFVRASSDFRRCRIPETLPFAFGDGAREWLLIPEYRVLYPYWDNRTVSICGATERNLWPWRDLLRKRTYFGRTQEQRGLMWYEYAVIMRDRIGRPCIAWGEIATHNHFVLSDGSCLFNQTAPTLSLPKTADPEMYAVILGLLNSSTACFWLRQVCHSKGARGVGGGLCTESWEQFYCFNTTNLIRFPLPLNRPSVIVIKLLDLVEQLLKVITVDSTVSFEAPTKASYAEANGRMVKSSSLLVALQEELDWQVYHLYGLLDEDPSLPPDRVPPIKPGERPFEILMARQMAAGELATTWFERHGSTPITEIPAHWPEYYRRAAERRLEIIQTNRDIALIERPEYKRRWNLPSWHELEKKALENWLLDRMEGWKKESRQPSPASRQEEQAAPTGDEAAEVPRSTIWAEPGLRTTARLADMFRRDPEFMRVAELLEGRPDFDLTEVVTRLALKQAVPFLPVLRYKDTGLRKRAEWEQVWEMQRGEDAGEKLDIPVPPKYKSADFLDSTYWSLRGSLDVPKERFILYPQLERDAHSSPVIGWAGWDHLEQARALAAYYMHAKQDEGWEPERLKPVLAGLLDLLPWLKQWHNDVDPQTGERMGNVFESFIESECHALGFTVESLKHWQPANGVGRRARARRARTRGATAPRG